MKKLRVFQTVKIKGIVPGTFSKSLGTVLLFLLIIPYLVTFLFGNLKEGNKERISLSDLDIKFGEESICVRNETAVGIENIPLEHYVADRLARSIDNSFEMETLKAQAVLIRSGILASAVTDEKERDIRSISIRDVNYGSILVTERIYEAVEQTKGVYLTYNSRPISGSYFAVSNGATRNGEELLLTEYPYLKSVLCSRDFLSADYTSSSVYEEKEFEMIWEQILSLQITEEEIIENKNITIEETDNIKLYRDSADYVLYLEKDGKYVSGEQFRMAFELASSSFRLLKEDQRITAVVKGVGHGLGMSQYAANEMAKEGEDYIQILNYFFQDIAINKL